MFITMAHVLNALEICRLMKNLLARQSTIFAGKTFTGQEQKLCELGIDPVKALTELHVKDENERILSEMDVYFVDD